MSKNQIVAEFMKANPTITSNKEIAAALAAQGIETTHVAAYKQSQKKKTETVPTFDANNFKKLLEVSEMIKEVGGVVEVECAILTLKPLLELVGELAMLESVVQALKALQPKEEVVQAAA